MMDEKFIESWLLKHIKKLVTNYGTEQNIYKKISIGSRLRAMRDFLNLIHQK